MHFGVVISRYQAERLFRLFTNFSSKRSQIFQGLSLAASLRLIFSLQFRGELCSCGGIMGKYAGGEELKPPTTVGQGKQPQLLSSSPRWAVANGAAVTVIVCDDKFDCYETADLIGSAVDALLIRPPPFDIQDEQTDATLYTVQSFIEVIFDLLDYIVGTDKRPDMDSNVICFLMCTLFELHY